MNHHGPATPTPIRWLVFVLAGITSWLLYLHRYAWGVVRPAFARQHPSLQPSELGFLDSAIMLTYTLGQIPGGLLGDWFGPRLVLSISIVLWSLALALVGFMPGYWGVFFALALLGLMQAGAYPAISKMSRSWFPNQYRTTLQGIVTALGRIGGGCSSIIVAALLIGLAGVSWQAALLYIAFPGMLLAVFLWTLVRDTPAQHPWSNRAEIELIDPSSAAATAIGAKPTWKFDTSPATVITFAAMLAYTFLSTFADMLYVFWIPTFLVEGKGFDSEEMGMFAPLPLVGGAVGGMLGGVLNDVMIRGLGNRRWGRSLVGLTGKALAGVMIAVSVSVPDGRLVMGLLFACKFFGDWALPTLWGTITDMGGKSAATVFAIVNTVGGIGGWVASPVMGVVKQSHGWDGLFYFIAGVYVAAACMWFIIDCTRRLTISSSAPAASGEPAT